MKFFVTEKQRLRRAKEKEVASQLAAKEEEEEELEERRRSLLIDSKWFRRLSDYVAQIPSPSPALKRRILALKDTPPSVLRKELAKAKEETRAWQEKAIARRLGSWEVKRKLEKKKPEELTETRPREMTRQEEKAEVKSEETIVKLIPSLIKQRKNKRLIPSEEELRNIERKRRLQMWNLLKQKVKEYDEEHPYYPRISTALARMDLDETLDKRD